MVDTPDPYRAKAREQEAEHAVDNGMCATQIRMSDEDRDTFIENVRLRMVAVAEEARKAGREEWAQDELEVIADLRCKLSLAGVEGSPPVGETTIGALLKRVKAAEHFHACEHKDRMAAEQEVAALKVELERRWQEGVRRGLELAIPAACMYCNGNCPPYESVPEGPNSASNWFHRRKEPRDHPTDAACCEATGIRWRLQSFHGDLIRAALSPPAADPWTCPKGCGHSKADHACLSPTCKRNGCHGHDGSDGPCDCSHVEPSSHADVLRMEGREEALQAVLTYLRHGDAASDDMPYGLFTTFQEWVAERDAELASLRERVKELEELADYRQRMIVDMELLAHKDQQKAEAEVAALKVELERLMAGLSNLLRVADKSHGEVHPEGSDSCEFCDVLDAAEGAWSEACRAALSPPDPQEGK